jgi:hypothetical protein
VAVQTKTCDFDSNMSGRHGRDHIIIGFTTPCTIITYHQRCEFESRSWRGVLDTTLCIKQSFKKNYSTWTSLIWHKYYKLSVRLINWVSILHQAQVGINLHLVPSLGPATGCTTVVCFKCNHFFLFKTTRHQIWA